MVVLSVPENILTFLPNTHALYSGKTANTVKMPFEMIGRAGLKNRVLGVHIVATWQIRLNDCAWQI